MHTKLTFEFAINPSLHIGDDIYFSSTNLDGITAAEPIYIGKVYSIFKNLNYIVINYDPTDDPVSQYVVGGATPPLVLFAKNISANESSLKGYYADVTFENASNTKCELFTFGSEISVSSK